MHAGVGAFTTGDAFGAVINSLLPLLAAVGVGGSSTANYKDVLKKFDFQRLVKAVMNAFSRRG